MKVQVTQENLNRALNSVARVANSRNALPILSNVLTKNHQQPAEPIGHQPRHRH